MSPIRAAFHSALIECLESMLAPLVRLTLHCGLGHSEFAAIVRRVFIDVASSEFGLRGRPANVSKISAKTGLSRKAIQRTRAVGRSPNWSPDDEVSPINTISHYWRFDEQFGTADGVPKKLPYEGANGFVSLVRKYAGDIPASTIRQEFLREGLATQSADGDLTLVRDFSFPEKLDEDFLRNAAFAIGHHAETIYRNALLADSGRATQEIHEKHGRFERYAWSRRLSAKEIGRFQSWVREQGDIFISEADAFISQLEYEREGEVDTVSAVSGVGVYFFKDN